jgi:HSP20 family protein
MRAASYERGSDEAMSVEATNINERQVPVSVETCRRDGSPSLVVEQDARLARETYTPPIDIHESPDGLILEADIPGATEGGLHVQLEDNVLHLHARIELRVPQDNRLIHEEFRPGDFHRSFILSDEVDRDRITAELKNGVLRILLPKADRVRARRIEITSPDAAGSSGGRG